MPVDANGARKMVAYDGPELDWLTFTAMKEGRFIVLTRDVVSPEADAILLEYRVGDGKWRDYTFEGKNGLRVELPYVGDYCQFRAKSVNENFCNVAGFRFNLTNADIPGGGGGVRIDGNIDSLLSRDCVYKGQYKSFMFKYLFSSHFYRRNYIGRLVLPAPVAVYGLYNGLFITSRYYGFPDIKAEIVQREGFAGFTGSEYGVPGAKLIDLVLPFKEVGFKSLSGFIYENDQFLSLDMSAITNDSTYCYIDIAGHNVLLQKVVLPKTELKTQQFVTAFNGCSGLREIRSTWHSWLDGATLNWVKNVSPTGDFYCPADLPLIWDDSHIPIGWTAHPEGKEPVPWQDPNESKYLRFTAEQDGSLLRLDKSADDPSLNARLEYKVNSGNWEEYTWGDDEGVTDKKLGHLISLPSAGDTVKWRAVGKNERFCVQGAGYRWKINYPMSCSGSVQSLLDSSVASSSVPDHGFRWLFDSTPITSLPEFTAETIGQFAYFQMFSNCPSITGHAVIKARRYGSNALNYIFENTKVTSCELLADKNDSAITGLVRSSPNFNKMTVHFSEWAVGGNPYWMERVYKVGIFSCPKTLPVKFGMTSSNSNFIPCGWLVDNGKSTFNDDEMINACYSNLSGDAHVSSILRDSLNKPSPIRCEFKGKVYWEPGSPLPSPHRPELGSYYELRSIYGMFNGMSEMRTIDLSLWDTSTVTDTRTAFEGCTSVTEAYARTQADCDKLNASPGKPTTWEFVVKPPEVN